MILVKRECPSTGDCATTSDTTRQSRLRSDGTGIWARMLTRLASGATTYYLLYGELPFVEAAQEEAKQRAMQEAFSAFAHLESESIPALFANDSSIDENNAGTNATGSFVVCGVIIFGVSSVC